MAEVWSSRIWTRQPQGLVQVNWNNPIARQLIGAWTGSNPNVNLVNGRSVSGASANIVGSRNGREYAGVLGASGVQILSSAPTGPACITILYRRRTTTNSDTTAFGSNGDRLQVHLPYADGVVYFDFGGFAAPNRVSVGGLTFGNDVWSFNNPSTGLQIWQNGILRASNSTSPVTRSIAGNLTMFGGGTASSDNANTALFLVHNRALSASEIAELSLNPWQLFSPQRQVSYFFPTTGITPLASSRVRTTQPQSTIAVDPRVNLLWFPWSAYSWARQVNGRLAVGRQGTSWRVAASSSAYLSSVQTAPPGAMTLVAVVKFNNFNATTFGSGPEDTGAVIYSQRTNALSVSPTLYVSSKPFGGNGVMQVGFGCDSDATAVMKINSLVTVVTGVWYYIAVSCSASGTTGVAINGVFDNSSPASSVGSWNSTWTGNFAYIGTNPQWGGGVDDADIEVAMLARMPYNLARSELESLSLNPWQLFSPQRLISYFGTAGGGTIYNVSISESSTGADSVSTTLFLYPSISESTTASDSLANTVTFASGITESATASDSLANTVTFASGISESATASDSLANTVTFASGISESATAVDSLTSTAVLNVAVTESSTAVESLTAGLLFATDITESTTASDSLVAGLLFASSVTESSTALDAVAATPIYLSVINETVTAADVISTIATQNVFVLEAVSAVDTVTVGGSQTAFIIENATAADAVTSRFLWEPIDTSQTPGWSNISTTQTANWSSITTTQTANWQPVNTGS